MGLWLVAPLALAGDAAAQIFPFTPVHLAIVATAQFPPRDVPVYGVAVNVIGIQDEVKGSRSESTTGWATLMDSAAGP